MRRDIHLRRAGRSSLRVLFLTLVLAGATPQQAQAGFIGDVFSAVGTMVTSVGKAVDGLLGGIFGTNQPNTVTVLPAPAQPAASTTNKKTDSLLKRLGAKIKKLTSRVKLQEKMLDRLEKMEDRLEDFNDSFDERMDEREKEGEEDEDEEDDEAETLDKPKNLGELLADVTSALGKNVKINVNDGLPSEDDATGEGSDDEEEEEEPAAEEEEEEDEETETDEEETEEEEETATGE